MTRRHFVALALALATTRPDARRVVALRDWRRTRDAVATACYASNGRFDRGRFERATEMDGAR